MAGINAVIRSFHHHFPEFMIDGYVRDNETEWGHGVYHADDRLLRLVREIIDAPEES